MMRRSLSVLLLVLAAAAPGCLPSRVVLDLDPGDGTLDETSVIDERGDGAKIAMIDVEGLISHLPPPGLLQGRSNPIDRVIARLEKAEEDPRVRAVILRINSPGGTVAASETLYREVVAFRERTGRPVVVSMSELATSGGYYVALGADHIVAQPTTVTGSIGVVFQTFNVSGGMQRFGISGRALVSRPNKDLANPFEPPVEEHFAILQEMVDEFYEEFRSLVTQRRPGLAGGRIEEIADGRVFTGRTAYELGLVDELGDLREAFAAAKRLAETERADLVKYHTEGLILNSAYAPAAAAEHAPALGGGVEVNVLKMERGAPGSGFWYVWEPGW